jgi:hypothetical protein
LEATESADLLECTRLEADDDRILGQQPLRAGDDVVAAIPPGALELAHDPDAPAQDVDRLLEPRLAAARRVVADHERPVTRRMDVELDEVGAKLDGALECGQRVLRVLRRGSAVRDHEDAHSRARFDTEIRLLPRAAVRLRREVGELHEVGDHRQILRVTCQ